MTDLSLAVADLPASEQRLIARAGLHAMKDPSEPLAFRDGVTDLDAARLIHAIERGYVVVPRGRVWTDLSGALRARMPHLTRVVQECLRVRLVSIAAVHFGGDVVRHQLVAAPVHLRGAHDLPEGWRHRLTDDATLIDCKACLAANR